MNDTIDNPRFRSEFYIAAAFGAFFLGFGDLLKNDKFATVLKMSEMIKQHLYPGFGAGASIALIFLVIFGIIVCWVHRPHTRIDAFSRGFSVFALFAVASPSEIVAVSQMPVNGQSAQAFSATFPIQSAYAQSGIETDFYNELYVPVKQGEAVVVLPDLKRLKTHPAVTVTIRDPKTAQIKFLEKFFGSKFKIQQPIGEYLLEVETSGYRRVEVAIGIENTIDAFSLHLVETKVPLSIQRLYGPFRSDLAPNLAEKYKQLGIKFFRSKEYIQAVQYYDKSIEIDKDDPTTHNYKGYSLFRAGEYGDALTALNESKKLAPDYFLARLNLAKVYCAQEKYDDARLVLLGGTQIHNDKIKVLKDDGEFRRHCKSILDEIPTETKS